MLPESLRWITEAFEPEGDPWLLLQIAQDLEKQGNDEAAATVLDRAFGIAPEIDKVCEARKRVLDRLEVREHGLIFRYVPGGPFLMGSRDGEPDEQPLHPVWLSAYWLAETPMNWDDYSRLHGWLEFGRPDGDAEESWRLSVYAKLSFFYSASEGSPQSRGPDEEEIALPMSMHSPGNRFDLKPVVGIAWQEAEELAQKITTPAIRYTLPSEAQWEKAARGGLIGARFAWGDAAASGETCDFDNFNLDPIGIKPSKQYPPNGYGLYAMNGCVWEWTSDWYDRDYYRESPSHDPTGPAKGKQKVLRGGSWADCVDVCTNTFRMSRGSVGWRQEKGSRDQLTPTIGFRLCRTIVAE